MKDSRAVLFLSQTYKTSGPEAKSTGAVRTQQEVHRHPERSSGTANHLKGIHERQHRERRSLNSFRGATQRWSVRDNEPTACLTKPKCMPYTSLLGAAAACQHPRGICRPPLHSLLQQCCYHNSSAGASPPMLTAPVTARSARQQVLV